MDGVSRAAASPIDMPINGKMYRLSPLTVEDFGVIENHILAGRVNPIQMVSSQKQHLDPDDYKMLLSMAYEDAKKTNKVSIVEQQEFLDTLEGQIYATWLCAKKNHSDLAIEDLKSDISSDANADIVSQLQIGTGMSEMGNSTGSQNLPASANENQQTGDESSGSSQESTTGVQK